jgi:glutaredoxin 3
MSAVIKIYTTQYCPHCMRAKGMLESKGVAFEEIDITDDDATRNETQKKTGWMTVPMIFIGDEFIGGADELFALESDGTLDEKLK